MHIVIIIVLMGMILRIIIVLQIIVRVQIDAYCYYYCSDVYDIAYYCSSADNGYDAYWCILLLF